MNRQEEKRSFAGQLQEFKKGAAILATDLKVPIVPVALDGPYLIWPRKSRRIRLAKVKISFGAPVDVQGIAANATDEEIVYQEIMATVKKEIQLMLEAMRATDN